MIGSLKKIYFAVLLVFVLASGLVVAQNTIRGIDREMIEADWLKQVESWREVISNSPNSLSTQTDAAGAVDGVKNGTYGFHTNMEPNPWWQIDLEQIVPVSKIIVYNRLDYAPGLHNTDTMQVKVSDDGVNWKLLHDCAGKHFGGIHGEAPLQLEFEKGKLNTRFIRLQIPSAQPIFFHLDEVEVFSYDNPNENIAEWKPANQSSICTWSKPKFKKSKEWDDRYPLDEARERIQKLADFLTEQGIDVTKTLDALNKSSESDPKAEYLRLRWIGRELVFQNPLLDFDRLLFAKRFTQQTYPDICLNHMPWVSRPGGDICILDNPFSVNGSEQKVTSLINGQLGPGHIRGIDLWWDADRVVFGYAKQPNFDFDPWPWPGCGERLIGHDLRLSQEPIHIFEIGTDGSGLRQITDHEMWSDLDPAYLPNGDVVFVSERCGFSLQCNNGPFHDETSCNLYSVRPDGTGMRWLSYNKDGDYQPHVFQDGTIGYCRWEYQERGWATIQSVWYMRPDGTGADALFKQHFDNPWALENTREIPGLPSGQRKFVSVAAAHHTLACGPICLLTPSRGLNNEAGLEIVTPGVFPPEGGMSGTPVAEGGCVENGGYYMYPWPLSDKFFLASYTYSNAYPAGMPDSFRGTDEKGYGLYVIDVFGNKELIYADPEISSSFPIPLKPRMRPPVLASSCDPKLEDRAVCTISDVSFGVDGVDRDEIKYVRVARRIGWPYTKETGGQRYEVDGSGWGLNWAPALIFGEVPVESDGSASFYVPSNVSIYFQLLDADKREIKRMRSFISFQPGESRGCVGCHETRETAPTPVGMTQAMKREPSVPTPPPWGTERCINYLADIQPVLDRNCVKCHEGLKPAAGLDFSGGLVSGSPMKTDHHVLHFDGLNRSYRTMIEKKLITYSNKHAPASELTQTRQFGSTKSKLIDAILDGPCSQHINIKPGDEDWYRLVTWIDANAQYHDRFVNSRPKHSPYDLPADAALQQLVSETHQKRCAECHTTKDVSRLDWVNLAEPEKSRFLTAPLARSSGGSGACEKAVYTDINDADYSKLLTAIEEAVEKSWKFPRRDMELFIEMQKKNRISVRPSKNQ